MNAEPDLVEPDATKGVRHRGIDLKGFAAARLKNDDLLCAASWTIVCAGCCRT